MTKTLLLSNSVLKCSQSDNDQIIKKLIAEHGTTFSIVPDFVKKDSRLSSTDKMVYAELLRLSNYKGYAWPSYKYLAESIGCGKTAAQDSCNKLVKLGYVIKHFKAYTSNRYFITNKIAFKKKINHNIPSIDFYRQKERAQKNAVRDILKIVSRAGLSKDQLIEKAIHQVLWAA